MRRSTRIASASAASPLFEIDDPAFAQGCGDLRNIHLSGLRIWKTRDLGSGMLQLHARMQNCTVEDFERVLERDANPAHPSLDLRFLPGAQGRIEGLTPEDAQRLASGSHDADLDWEELPLSPGSPPPPLPSAKKAALTGNPPAASAASTSPPRPFISPSPPRTGIKGMTR